MELARTETGEEWLHRPIEHGWCRYESMIDGTLGLEDVAEMNDAIDLMLENRARVQAKD